ncbi:hypothetical protein TTX_1789 [Thermoproteus tenax Kra 1]|uniref:Uncharacterized protein n=1 Tax=Thermoproteus tenax (strain ATCC 35583 / DSM 2078 / JCM 9277 / NBRC 100435 / Kra 1) TaxID=768679 RepID=G4RLG4_THETK|nr:hypothetical protein TTX_1789 [Thermoproteus tenax Kra 1]
MSSGFSCPREYYNKYGRLVRMFRRSDVEARLEEVRKLPRQSEHRSDKN